MPPAGIAFAPGRVNLVGEHTDYNDGFVLPMAIEEGIAAAFAPNGEGVLRVHACDVGETREVPIAALQGGRVRRVRMVPLRRRHGLDDERGRHARGRNHDDARRESAVRRRALVVRGRWSSRRAGRSPRLPAPTGIPARMSLIAQRAEQAFAGVACGIMDQMAVACARAGRALLLDCRSLATSDVLIPADVRIVIVNSGVRRSLATSAYNERRAACERAVAAVRTFVAGRARAARRRRTCPRAGARTRWTTRRSAARRTSSRRTAARRGSRRRCERGDPAEAGRVMLESHASLRDLYEVSCPELDLLVALSMGQKGCHGARLTGAGFGGCAIALVDAESVDSFARDVARDYAARTRLEPQVIVSRPAEGRGW